MITMKIASVTRQPFTGRADGKPYERMYIKDAEGHEYVSLTSKWNERWKVGDEVSFNYDTSGQYPKMTPAGGGSFRGMGAPNSDEVLKALAAAEERILSRIEAMETAMKVMLAFPPEK